MQARGFEAVRTQQKRLEALRLLSLSLSLLLINSYYSNFLAYKTNAFYSYVFSRLQHLVLRLPIFFNVKPIQQGQQYVEFSSTYAGEK